jgi:hypothetical protein
MLQTCLTSWVIVTGATNPTQILCFFGVMQLPKLKRGREQETYRTSTVSEACIALCITNYNLKSAAVVVASTDEDGILAELNF